MIYKWLNEEKTLLIEQSDDGTHGRVVEVGMAEFAAMASRDLNCWNVHPRKCGLHCTGPDCLPKCKLLRTPIQRPQLCGNTRQRLSATAHSLMRWVLGHSRQNKSTTCFARQWGLNFEQVYRSNRLAQAPRQWLRHNGGAGVGGRAQGQQFVGACAVGFCV